MARETGISIATNGVLSLGFALATFGRAEQVPVSGLGGLVLDSLPQSFMVALMSTLVPTALTRARIRRGLVAPVVGKPLPMPHNLVLRALLVAMGAMVLGTGLQAILLPALTPENWSVAAASTYKALYGALLGALITPAVIHGALADKAPASSS